MRRFLVFAAWFAFFAGMVLDATGYIGLEQHIGSLALATFLMVAAIYEAVSTPCGKIEEECCER